MNKLILYSFAIIIITGCVATQKNRRSAISLNGVLEQYAKESYRLSPLNATANNVNDYNDKLAINISEAWVQEATTFNKRYLDTLKLIQYADLTDLEKRNADV
jgi:hypothetical protein